MQPTLPTTIRLNRCYILNLNEIKSLFLYEALGVCGYNLTSLLKFLSSLYINFTIFIH